MASVLPPLAVPVSWNTTLSGTIDPRFASFTIDSWWLEMWAKGMNGSYDYSNPRLGQLVRMLGPSVLRVGGGKSDTSFFGGGTHPSPGGLCHRTYCWNLTVPSWETFAQFTKASGVDLVFGLNAVTRHADAEGRPATWDSRNAAAFIRYNRRHAHAVWGYELGNEPGDHPTGPAGWANISLAAHAADFGDLQVRSPPGKPWHPSLPDRTDVRRGMLVLQNLLAAEFGRGARRPLVLGPDACMPDYMRGLLALSPAINITTAHKYA